MKSEFKSGILFGIAGLVFIVGISIVFGAQKVDANEMVDLRLVSTNGNWFFQPSSQNLYLNGGAGDQTFILQNPLKIYQFDSTSLPAMSIVGLNKPTELKISSMENTTTGRSTSSILFSSFINDDTYPAYITDKFRITADYLKSAYNGNFLHFQDAGTNSNLLTIHNSGKVGIGRSEPKSLLHLYYKDNGGTQLTEGLRIERGTVPGQYTTISNYSGRTRINNVTRSGDPYGGLTISFSKDDGNSSVEVFTISDTGNVGIGTTTPGAKLDVKGNLHATEIKVLTASIDNLTLNNQGWSDYVFNDDYKLMPLHEVEKSIQKENHLPGVPSAQEVKEKGINIGQMQAKLLEKIEELTLYVIDQDKKLSRLEKENQDLKKRISLD